MAVAPSILSDNSSLSQASPSLTGSSPTEESTFTSSAASSTTTQNQYNNGTLHTLSTVLPGFLIAFLCVISMFLVCGIFHGRRRRALLLRQMHPIHIELPIIASVPARSQRKKKRLVKPKLWEVEVKGTSWDWDMGASKPVAAELLAVSKSIPIKIESPKRRIWFIPSLGHSHKPEEKQAPTQRAQIMVLVTMPVPRSERPSREYVLGTTYLPYRPEEDLDELEKEEDKPQVLGGRVVLERIRAFEHLPFE